MASPTPPLPDSPLFGSPQLGSNGEQTNSESLTIECSICQETYTVPKVSSCPHRFCQPCLEKLKDNHNKTHFYKSEQDCGLPPEGISRLLSNYPINNALETAASGGSLLSCTVCKSRDSLAVARCYDCANYLCGNCVMVHQNIHSFEEHRVVNLKVDQLANVDHPKELHDYDDISEVGPKQVAILGELLQKNNDFRNAAKSVEHFSSHLQLQYHKAQSDITATINFCCSVIEERKQEFIKELEDLYNTEMVSLSLIRKKVQEMVEKVQQVSLFVDSFMKYSSNSEILKFKDVLDKTLQAIIAYKPEVNMQSMDLEFPSNCKAIQVGVRNYFSYIRHNSEGAPITKHRQIASSNGVVNSDRTYQNRHVYKPNIISKRFGSANSLEQISTSLSDISPCGKLSSGPTDIFQNVTADSVITEPIIDSKPVIDSESIINSEPIIDKEPIIDSETIIDSEPVIDLTSKFISASMYPVKYQIKRQKMLYHCKFGEFGVMEGQFTEPHGVAVNAQNDILVADTDNHRIQIFDKEGRFKFQFGKCGKLDGQLLCPNKVAVEKTSGDIIVTERNPTNQIQIYNKYGKFVRKFGANILQNPRGVTVDSKGRIIVIECKIMRVIIFDQFGNVLRKFGCAEHLKFPNGVVVNDKEEIFISDNIGHCVKVFNYNGVFICQIGGEGLTNYPIGVCINQNGEILVADNRNKFNITIFTQDGQLVNASESKASHSQCFAVAVMDDGSAVLATKDYRLYIYRYMQIPGI